MTHHVLALSNFLQRPVTEAIYAISKVVTTLSDSYQRSQRYKKTVKELSGLTDRELHDMGISRYDIEEIARKVS